MKIKQISNGFIVTIPPDMDSEIEQSIAFTYEDDKETEHKAVTDLLTFVAEHFGYHHDKWEKNNLNITWDKKGRKVD